MRSWWGLWCDSRVQRVWQPQPLEWAETAPGPATTERMHALGSVPGFSFRELSRRVRFQLSSFCGSESLRFFNKLNTTTVSSGSDSDGTQNKTQPFCLIREQSFAE